MDTAFGNKLICNTAYFADCKSAETQNSLPGQGEEVGSIPTYGTKGIVEALRERSPGFYRETMVRVHPTVKCLKSEQVSPGLLRSLS